MSKSKIGQRFTRLLVVDVADPYISPKGVKSNRWKCLCDCGNFINLRSCALTTQNNRSCGCLLDESRKRGNPIHQDVLELTGLRDFPNGGLLLVWTERACT